MLSLIKHAASAKNIEQRREYLRKIKQQTNTLIDIYCFGIILLFMLSGGYDWLSTMELQSTFEIKMQKAEYFADLGTMQVLRAILKRCLLITRSEQPFDRISDMLPNLKTAKTNVERIMRENNISYYDYDTSSKPMYEFEEGRRKEQLLIKDYTLLTAQDFSQTEHDIFQAKHRHRGQGLMSNLQ